MAYYNPYEDFAKSTTSGLYSGTNQGSPQQAGQAGQTNTAAKLAPFTGSNPFANFKPLPTGNFNYQPQQRMGADQAMGLGIGALGGLAETLSQKSTDPLDFSVDKWAGYAGSAKGFGSGGPIAAIVGGSLAQLGTFNKVHENLRKTNPGVNAVQYDANGRPLYAGQGIADAQNTAQALREGVKAINTSVDPATHLISFVRGTERQLLRKRRRVMQGIQAGQQEYNKQATSYNQTQNAMAQYRSMTDKTNRLRSLYNIGNNTLY